MEKFLPHIRIDFVDFVGLKVKPTNHFTGMLPFGKVRLRLNGSSPAPSLSTISIDVYVDEGEGRPGKVPHASLPWPRLDLLDFALIDPTILQLWFYPPFEVVRNLVKLSPLLPMVPVETFPLSHVHLVH